MYLLKDCNGIGSGTTQLKWNYMFNEEYQQGRYFGVFKCIFQPGNQMLFHLIIISFYFIIILFYFLNNHEDKPDY